MKKTGKSGKRHNKFLAPLLALIVLLAACSSQGGDNAPDSRQKEAVQTEETSAETSATDEIRMDGQLTGDMLMQPSGDTEGEAADPDGYSQEPLEVHYIDVGQGSATLLKSGRHAMLIGKSRLPCTDASGCGSYRRCSGHYYEIWDRTAFSF